MTAMQDINNPSYWAERLAQAKGGHLHHAVFKCPLERWQAIEAKHQQILARHITKDPTTGKWPSILDCGCGWGRLITLLPRNWDGTYLGIDLSPDFIALAKQLHPGHWFRVMDIAVPHSFEFHYQNGYEEDQFEWAVLISIRPMIIRNLGAKEWAKMEANIRRHAKSLLYLEYDPEDEGSVE